MPLTCAALKQAVGLQHWRLVRWRHALIGFGTVQVLLVAYLVATSGASAPQFDQRRSAQFDSQKLAVAIAPATRLQLGGRIRVIAGSQRLVGVLALRIAERPLVLIDGRHELSPWLPDDLSKLCGILWVGRDHEFPPLHIERHVVSGGLWWGVELLADDPHVCRADP